MIHRQALRPGLVFSDPREENRAFYRYECRNNAGDLIAEVVGDHTGRKKVFLERELADLVAVPGRPIADLDLTHYIGKRVRLRTSAAELRVEVASTARHEILLNGEPHAVDVSITSVDGETYHVSRLLEITVLDPV